MAQHFQVRYTDDIDGTDLGETANTLSFAFEGKEYSIDLSDDKNTRYEGDVTAFYPNGKEKWHGTFVNGKPNGYFTMMMRDGSIATAQFINGKSRLNYFVVTSPDGTMSRRDIKELESFLKIK